MNTFLNTAINKNFQLNQDIKKLTKQIYKFLKVYAYKSAFLQAEIKDLKHNDYLNIVSRLFGYADYNQYNKDSNKKNISIEDLLSGFEKFLYSLSNKGSYYNSDINQIVNTLYLYLTSTEQDLYREKRSVTAKIERRIKKLKKDTETSYKAEELKRLYTIVSNTYFQPIIIDYRSLIIYKENLPVFLDFIDDQDYELASLFLKYYDLRNSIIIKKYVKDEKFSDNIGEYLYLLEDFFEGKYIPFERMEFLANQYKHYHHGLNDCIYRENINNFKAYIAEKTIGRTVLVKGIFNTIDSDGSSYGYRDITCNKDNEWTIFDITLANNDSFSLLILADGTLAAQKKFNNEIACVILGTYNLDSNDSLIWTIPMVERNSVIKERFRFFYPKKEDDKFIFKLSFTKQYDLIELSRNGILQDNKLILSFKEIMKSLYEKEISKLQDISDLDDNYIKNYNQDYKD